MLRQIALSLMLGTALNCLVAVGAATVVPLGNRSLVSDTAKQVVVVPQPTLAASARLCEAFRITVVEARNHDHQSRYVALHHKPPSWSALDAKTTRVPWVGVEQATGWPWPAWAANLEIDYYATPAQRFRYSHCVVVGTPDSLGDGARLIPLRPLWIGVVANSIVLGALCLLGRRMYQQIRIGIRRTGNQCTTCGYPRKTRSNSCPECGSAY